jgi:hypothetical protein
MVVADEFINYAHLTSLSRELATQREAQPTRRPRFKHPTGVRLAASISTPTDILIRREGACMRFGGNIRKCVVGRALDRRECSRRTHFKFGGTFVAAGGSLYDSMNAT